MMNRLNLECALNITCAKEAEACGNYELAVEYGTIDEAQDAWDAYARAVVERAHAAYRLEGLM